MLQVSPYLTFSGNCREAMTFYKDCLGGELSLMNVGDIPMGVGCPEGQKDQIMHSSLTKEGFLIMASDMMGQSELVKGNNFAMSLNCGSEEELNTLFNALVEGGKVGLPVGKQFWGDIFGMLTDKFGINWLLNYTPPAA